MKIVFSVLILFAAVAAKAQDSSFTYSKIIIVDSVSKDELFNRALIWCSKLFKDSKSAINVKEREGGIISGKAYLDSYYKYLNKSGKLTDGLIYAHYNFDWLIQIKEGKVKFSISDVIIHSDPFDYPVTISSIAPAKIVMLSQQRNDAEWQASKEEFVNSLNDLMSQLQKELNTNSDF